MSKSANIVFPDVSDEYPLSYQICLKFVKRSSIIDKAKYVEFTVEWIYDYAFRNNVKVYDILVEPTYIAFKIDTDLNIDLKKFINSIARKLLQDLDDKFDDIQIYERFVRYYKRNVYGYNLLWHKPYFVRTLDSDTQQKFIDYI